MKKIIVWIIPLVIFTIFSIYFCVDIIKVRNNNEELYNYFEENELLDQDSNVNLSSVKEKKKELEEKIISLSDSGDIAIDEILNRVDNIKKENESKLSEIERLSIELDSLNEKESSLADEYNSLNKKYNNLVWKEKERIKRESTVMLDNVPTINQYPNYPTGCEATALTILLRYYGISIGVDDVINNLKKGDLPYYEEGIRYGGNPELEFIGNPYNDYSYGVYNLPIGDVSNLYKSGVNIRNDFSFSEVLDLVKEGRPVVVWTSIGLALPYISSTWTYKPTMETIFWKTNEHAVVVVGYNDSEVIISDPMGGNIKYQNRSTFESRYNYFGKKAVYY